MNKIQKCKCGAPVESSIGITYKSCYDCWWAQDPRNEANKEKYPEWHSKCENVTQPILPEVLITQLNSENAKLKMELEKTIEDLKDFEILAKGWKDGYNREVRELKIKNKHLEQIIEELQNEIKDSKDQNE